MHDESDNVATRIVIFGPSYISGTTPQNNVEMVSQRQTARQAWTLTGCDSHIYWIYRLFDKWVNPHDGTYDTHLDSSINPVNC